MAIDISTRSLHSDSARETSSSASTCRASISAWVLASGAVDLKSNSRIKNRRTTLQMASSSSATPAAVRFERNVATKFRMGSLATPLAAILPKNSVLHAAARAQSSTVLVRTGYCLARPLSGDGELMTILRNIVPRATRNLFGNLLKSAVLWGERDLPLRLDLEERVPTRADAFEHQVIERVTLVDALETHPGHPCAGHSPCLASGQHRQEVERPELALDIYARPAPRRWAGSPFLGLARLATRHRVVVRTVLPRVKEWGRVRQRVSWQTHVHRSVAVAAELAQLPRRWVMFILNVGRFHLGCLLRCTRYITPRMATFGRKANFGIETRRLRIVLLRTRIVPDFIGDLDCCTAVETWRAFWAFNSRIGNSET